jgi:hypothetical protein
MIYSSALKMEECSSEMLVNMTSHLRKQCPLTGISIDIESKSKAIPITGCGGL